MKGGKYTNTLSKIWVKEIISYTRYPSKCFIQIYRALYGGAIMELIPMSSNMADGNQQKHLLQIFFCYRVCGKSVKLLLKELTNIKVRLFLILELFS